MIKSFNYSILLIFVNEKINRINCDLSLFIIYTKKYFAFKYNDKLNAANTLV